MIRSLICLGLMLSVSAAMAEETSPAEKVIADAIKMLEKERDTIGDAIEQAKIDKAIRELEILIEDPDNPRPHVKPEPIDFEVSPAALKKKFSGKAIFNAKTGELILTYDFPGKAQLADFETEGLNVAINRKMLMIDAGDSVKHIAKFKSFTATTAMTFKSLRGSGVASTSGVTLDTGGPRQQTMFLRIPGLPGVNRAVPPNFRSGTVPVSLTVTPTKASIRFGTETLSQQTQVTEDIHQVVLNGGTEGSAFGALTIVGIPDPAWLKEFLSKD
jgi:hypothetical protein